MSFNQNHKRLIKIFLVVTFASFLYMIYSPSGENGIQGHFKNQNKSKSHTVPTTTTHNEYSQQSEDYNYLQKCRNQVVAVKMTNDGPSNMKDYVLVCLDLLMHLCQPDHRVPKSLPDIDLSKDQDVDVNDQYLQLVGALAKQKDSYKPSIFATESVEMLEAFIVCKLLDLNVDQKKMEKEQDVPDYVVKFAQNKDDLEGKIEFLNQKFKDLI